MALNIQEIPPILSSPSFKKFGKSFLDPLNIPSLLSKGYFKSNTDAIKESKEIFGIKLYNDVLSGLIKDYTIDYKKFRESVKSENESFVSAELPESFTGLRPYWEKSEDYYGLCGFTQDPIALTSHNNWIDFIEMGSGGASKMKRYMSVVGGSIYFDWFKFQIWDGSTPPQFQINLKFNAQYDAFYEVFIPCMLLLSMSFPKEVEVKEIKVGDEKIKLAGLLAPPGDSAYELVKKVSESLLAVGSGIKNSIVKGAVGVLTALEDGVLELAGDIRTSLGLPAKPPVNSFNLRFGKFLLYTKMIMENVVVSFDFKSLNRNGFPLSATAQVTLKKQEMYTSNKVSIDIEKAIDLNNNSKSQVYPNL